MKRLIIVCCVFVGILILAAISVNFVPNEKADNHYAAMYCSRMVKEFMKSPDSYHMTNYFTKNDDMSNDLINKMAEDNLAGKSFNSQNMKHDLFYVFIDYRAKNPMGVELVGEAYCRIPREKFYSGNMKIMTTYFTKYGLLSINDERITRDQKLYVSLLAEDDIKGYGNYRKKLNYLWYSIFR